MRRIISITIVLILLFSSITLTKNIWDSNRKIADLNEIKEEERSLKLENEQLEKELEKSKSKSFIEEVARNKLGLSKPGETLYVVESKPPEEVVDGDTPDESSSNFESWLSVFFD